MDLNYLDFEQPIAELEAKIRELRKIESDNDINISDVLAQHEDRLEALTKSIFANLSDWQIHQISRHPRRPYTLDYVEHIFTDFLQLHGDRAYADDPAIVCGMARLDKKPVMVIGHQKGRDTKQRKYRNFGMPRPEGYRKALRVMKLAEKFKLPLICLIDTPGAYPGIDAEKRGQSEAIARNLFEMSKLKTPIVCVITGEGGSGGALAIGVGDRLIMLEYSTYSVISPEGCAAILWKSNDKDKGQSLKNQQQAAEAMGITSDRIRELGLLDEVVREPLGGAHRNYQATAASLKDALIRHMNDLQQRTLDDLLSIRYQRLMGFGAYVEEVVK